MANIAIFCDGTWNSRDAKGNTNVHRLHLNTPDLTPELVAQFPQYFEGVGNERGRNVVARKADKYFGGALGWGLIDKIEKAYRFLATHYTPGDRIYLFGFSRGAYTARSLAGLIYACGIPNAANIHRIPEAIEFYRDRSEATKPNAQKSHEFRAGFAPHVHTSPEEAKFREEHDPPLDPGKRLTIDYMGIWDTVGALGVPGVLGVFAKPFNAKYLFHDHKLSKMVLAGRHALATDEKRLFFPPTPWINLPTLNGDNPGIPFRQHWFPGDHGTVGGSAGKDGKERRGIPDAAMHWIMEGAHKAGLHVDPDYMKQTEENARYDTGLFAAKQRPWGKKRVATKHTEDVSDCALHRLAFGGKNGARYDPKTLRPLRSKIAAQLPSTPGSLFA